MSYNLFLDDWREPKHCRDYRNDGSVYDTEEWIVVTSFDEFYKVIKERGIPKLVSFDYQLNSDKTGLDCAEFLKFECEETKHPIPKFLVHSSWPGIQASFYNLLKITT